jgi:hypothetical protein
MVLRQEGRNAKFKFCTSIEICTLAQRYGFEIPPEHKALNRYSSFYDPLSKSGTILK